MVCWFAGGTTSSTLKMNGKDSAIIQIRNVLVEVSLADEQDSFRYTGMKGTMEYTPSKENLENRLGYEGFVSGTPDENTFFLTSAPKNGRIAVYVYAGAFSSFFNLRVDDAKKLVAMISTAIAELESSTEECLTTYEIPSDMPEEVVQ